MNLLTTLKLTTNQQTILALAASTADPLLNVRQMSSSLNLSSARDGLARMGLIEFTPTKASLTKAGENVAKMNQIVDQGGQLSDLGQHLVTTAIGGDVPDSDDLVGGSLDFSDNMPDLNATPGIDQPKFESYSLLRSLLVM